MATVHAPRRSTWQSFPSLTQVFLRGWDHDGNLPKQIPQLAQAMDQPTAALIKDLKQRGMLDDTLVIWGGEFGRTVYSQGTLTKDNYGRDHHARNYTMWRTPSTSTT